MKRRVQVILGVTTLATMGCITSGRDFPSDVEWIKKDMTSKNDVQMLLGPPFAVGNSAGVPTWTYAYYKYQLFGRTFHKELKLYWHPNSQVKHFSFNSSFPPDLPGEKKGESPPPPGPVKGQERSQAYPSY